MKKDFDSWNSEKKNIDKILTTQYDIVLNGFEIGGGYVQELCIP